MLRTAVEANQNAFFVYINKNISSLVNLSKFETKQTQVAIFSKSQLQHKFSAVIS
jgi:hypothetical protein